MMSGSLTAFEEKIVQNIQRLLFGGLLAGVMTGCTTDGRITDFIPDTLFRKHRADSAFPNINSIPSARDARLLELSTPDPEITGWREELAVKQDALQQSRIPEKRIYDDPKWALDE